MQVLPGVVMALGAATLFAAPHAHADPDDVVARPLVLERGGLELRLTAAINVQPREIAHPLSLAPDAWWGLSSRWTVGIIHSDASLDQIASRASLCVRETAMATCDRLYHGGGVDLRYGALSGQFALAPRMRAVIRDTDPFKPAITLGALARWSRGRFAITTDPYLRLPLANHNLGNRAAIELPVWLAIQPSDGWAIGLQTGFASDLRVLRDGGHCPLGVEATARLTEALDLDVLAGWGSLFGPQHDGKRGTVMIAVAWRP